MPYERFNKPLNTTAIEELGDTPRPSTDKFIRNDTRHLPYESGMSTENYTMYEPPQPPSFSNLSQVQNYTTCPDVYLHIMNCPVCKQIYGRDNKMSTVYICIIIILMIFCVLLFRKAFP